MHGGMVMDGVDGSSAPRSIGVSEEWNAVASRTSMEGMTDWPYSPERLLGEFSEQGRNHW